jgi:hypothetical protein
MLNAFPVISNAVGILSRVTGFIELNFMRILLGQGVQGLANNYTIGCALWRAHTHTHTHTYTHTHTHARSFCKFLRLNFRWQYILPPSSPLLHVTLGSPVAHIHPYTLIPLYALLGLQFFYICRKHTSPTRVHVLFRDFCNSVCIIFAFILEPYYCCSH